MKKQLLTLVTLAGMGTSLMAAVDWDAVIKKDQDAVKKAEEALAPFQATINKAQAAINEVNDRKKLIAPLPGVGGLQRAVRSQLGFSSGPLSQGGNYIAPRLCSMGYVTEIYGGAGGVVDRIGMRCSNGQDLGTMGGDGGTPYSFKNPNGFDAISGKYTDVVSQLTPQLEKVAIGSPVGGGGGGDFQLACPPGKKIIGYTGRSGRFIDQLQIIYGDPNLPEISVSQDTINKTKEAMAPYAKELDDAKATLKKDQDAKALLAQQAASQANLMAAQQREQQLEIGKTVSGEVAQK